MDEIAIKIELQDIERNLEYLFVLVSTGKITDDDYVKLSSYPYRRKVTLTNQLENIKNP